MYFLHEKEEAEDGRDDVKGSDRLVLCLPAALISLLRCRKAKGTAAPPHNAQAGTIWRPVP